jgi:ubiquinone/menaquinone biosynthesis C-methylase UbiE
MPTLEEFFLERHGGRPAGLGMNPKLCWQYRYFSPDLIYEFKVAKLIGPDTVWLDVGGGRQIFPSNERLATLLASECRLLVSVDPSENVLENRFAHERVRCLVEEYKTDHRFDLVTMRMVAEHIEEPDSALSALHGLVKPGGQVVVYTVNKWSPASVIAALTPMKVHNLAKRLLWNTEERDTFPVFYRMNTHQKLKGAATLERRPTNVESVI